MFLSLETKVKLVRILSSLHCKGIGQLIMKHLFIVNPIAGKGKALEYIPKIEEYFQQ